MKMIEPHRLRRALVGLSSAFFITVAAGPLQAQAPTEAWLLGDWCQIVVSPEDGEERNRWTFETDGVFLRHMEHNDPTRTTWALKGGELHISMIGRLKIKPVSNDEFRYKQFVDIRVIRGPCP